jgi:hypothetical protein
MGGISDRLRYMERRLEAFGLDGAEGARHLAAALCSIVWLQVKFPVAYAFLQKEMLEVLQGLQKAMKLRGDALSRDHWRLVCESAYRQVETTHEGGYLKVMKMLVRWARTMPFMEGVLGKAEASVGGVMMNVIEEIKQMMKTSSEDVQAGRVEEKVPDLSAAMWRSYDVPTNMKSNAIAACMEERAVLALEYMEDLKNQVVAAMQADGSWGQVFGEAATPVEAQLKGLVQRVLGEAATTEAPVEKRLYKKTYIVLHGQCVEDVKAKKAKTADVVKPSD